MRRMLRSGAALWLLLSLVPLTACETKRVWLELPSFADGSIEGIWLWRRSDASGAWEREDARAGFELSSRLDGAETPDTVRVGLWYMRWEDPGTYRVSAYGPSGESALSETTLDL